MIIDYAFLPDNAIQALENEMEIPSLDFFDIEANEIEENPLLKYKEEGFTVNHEL